MLMPPDIGRVLSFYDLGPVESATRAYRGYVNETVFVQTSQGRFVLRRNHRRLSEDFHRYRHALIAWLVQQGFPTPPVLPTRSGDTLLLMEGRSYEVMPFVNGKDYDPTHPGQLVNVGAALAHYHRATEGFAPPPGEQSVRYSAQDVMALTERLIERDVMGELFDILRWYDMRAAHLRSVLPVETYRQLPHVVIHGDIHRDNFLFTPDDEVAALIDFDQVAWDGRIADLADAIVGFATDCTTTSNGLTWGVYAGPIIEECATRMVAAYTEVAPLSEAEVWALPIIIELLWLQGELGRVFSTPEGAPDYHLNVLEQGRWLSNWMSERSERLVHRWSHLRPEGRARLLLPATAQAA